MSPAPGQYNMTIDSQACKDYTCRITVQICETVKVSLLSKRRCLLQLQLQAGKAIANMWSTLGLKIIQIWHVESEGVPPGGLYSEHRWPRKHHGHWILSCPDSSVSRGSALKAEDSGFKFQLGQGFSAHASKWVLNYLQNSEEQGFFLGGEIWHLSCDQDYILATCF